MGLSRNKKNKGKDGTKPKKDNPPKKCDKTKKLDSEDTLSSIFKTEEQHELKKILKTNNLTSMPLIVGATILGKFDVVKKLIKNGKDVNITTADKSASLRWAVKNKNLDMIDLLLSRGADVMSVDDSGENVIFMALNSSEWDENCFLVFWKSIQRTNKINLDLANKTGNSILHFAVKRKWMRLIEKLIENKVNINSCNNKGVSALTMAAARNDLKLVNILLKSNANVFQEDLKGNTAICYTIANIVRKNSKPPYETLQMLTKNFTKENYAQYIDRRFYFLISPPNNDLNSYHSNISKITTSVIIFIVNQIPKGVDLLLALDALDKIKMAIELHMEHFDYLQSLLFLLYLLLRWCDCCTKIKNSTSQVDISEKFVQSSLPDVLLYALRFYNGTNYMKQVVPNIFLSLFLTCTQSTLAKNWLKDHLEDLQEHYQHYLEISVVNFNVKEDDNHIKIIKDKIKQFKNTFEELKAELVHANEVQVSTEVVPESETEKPEEKKIEEPVQRGKNYAKRMRRRAKALKARIDKIRSADVVERIRIHVKNKTSSSSNIVKEEQKNLDTSNEKEIIEIKLDHPVDSSSNESVEAKSTIPDNSRLFNDNFVTSNNNDPGPTTQENCELHDEPMKAYFDEKTCKSRLNEFEDSLIKLKIMLNDIICKYKFLWALDQKMDHPFFLGGNGDNIHPLLEGTREEQLEKLKHLLPFIEQQYLSKLVDNFNKTIAKIQELYQQNNENYKILSDQLKDLLYRHEIRGEKYCQFEKPPNDDNIEVMSGKYGAIGDHLDRSAIKDEYKPEEELIFEQMNYGGIGDYFRTETPEIPPGFENEIPRYIPTYIDLIENILPPQFGPSPLDISPEEVVYLNDMSFVDFKATHLTDEEKEVIRIRTEKNSYHLVESICNVCDSDNLADGWDEDIISPYMKKMMMKAEQKKEENLPIQKHYPVSYYLQQDSSSDDAGNDSKHRENGGELVLYEKMEAENASRWDVKIQSLQSIIKKQILPKGAAQFCICFPDRNEFVDFISIQRYFTERYIVLTDGYFGTGVLGFDKTGGPVIIKKIITFTSKQVYEHISSILRVRHKYILSYTVCSFDTSAKSLYLGTPLCEYNLGEYVMMLKRQERPAFITNELAFQLLRGLEHLHNNKPEAIVHGNLKPSNVLIDLRGKVQLAEFGLYKTLFVRDRAPNSSLIWFARETYESYTNNRGMVCSLAADIQVAGMLIYFAITWGLHAFGFGSEDILYNLMQGKPKIESVGVEAQDLISWMLAYDMNDRPTCAQILNHVFFWSESERWHFILRCSGLTESGFPIIHFPLNFFHKFLEGASKDQDVCGDWISRIKKHLPHLEMFLNKFDSKVCSPVGVLKFVRKMLPEEPEDKLKEMVFDGFPELPLVLFRLVENTEWANHSVFKPFFRC